MMANSFLKQFVLLCLQCAVTLVESELSDNGDNYDIRQVLNTTQKLWLFQQSYNGSEEDFHSIRMPYTCLYMNKTALVDTVYNFTETLRYSEIEDTVPYYGILVKTGQENKPWNALQVYKPPVGNDKYKQLILEYTQDNSNKKCIVFIVSPLTQTLKESQIYCEMYLPEDSVDAGPTQDCLRYFRGRCNTEYRIYNESCKTPVPQKNNFLRTHKPREEADNIDNNSRGRNRNDARGIN
uniref:Putative group v salivary lipocalin n=1 Tax=Rhipicephalus pulchellus TaxID=72859 RepID=L7LR22_RHIPC